MKTIPLLKNRCVIYCRVSTKEQVEEGGSLATQEKICTDYALRNELDVAKVFIEKGESAKNADRTELKEMLTFCANKKNGVNAVVIYKIDRLARNTDDYRQIRLVLKSRGIEIKSTSELFEDTPAGRFMESMLSTVAQFDNDVRTERSVNGMRDAMREGRFVWRSPIGYDNGIVDGKPNLVPNAMAPFVRKAYDLVTQKSLSVSEIHAQLVKEGLVNSKGDPVALSHFYGTLSNELYTGWINGLGERNRGYYTPLITEEQFAIVQGILHNKGRVKGKHKKDRPDFPLRRFFIHPTGRKLTGCWSQGRTKKYAYYRYHKTGTTYAKDFVEKVYKAYIAKYILTASQFEKISAKVLDNFEKIVGERQVETETARKQIVTLKNRRIVLIQKNVDGVIPDELLKEQLESIQAEIYARSEKISAPMEYTKKSLQEAIAAVLEYVKDPVKAWEDAPFTIQQKLQWFNSPKGIIFDGTDCRTIEKSFVFKPRRLIRSMFSLTVTPKSQEYNNAIITNEHAILEIAKQCIELACILQGRDCPP